MAPMGARGSRRAGPPSPRRPHDPGSLPRVSAPFLGRDAARHPGLAGRGRGHRPRRVRCRRDAPSRWAPTRRPTCASAPRTGAYVLKIANPAFGADVLDLQNKAMQHVAGRGHRARRAGPGRRPRRDATWSGSPIRGVDHHVRLLTFVAGDMFSDAGYLGDEVLGQFGALAARLSAALATFDHPGGRPRPAVRQPARRARRRAHWRARSPTPTAGRPRPTSATAPGPRSTRWSVSCGCQVVHADLADYNVVAHARRRRAALPDRRHRLRRRRAELAGRRPRHGDHLAARPRATLPAAGRVRRGRRLPRASPR